MPFPDKHVEPELAKLIKNAIAEACAELRSSDGYDGVHARTVMALDVIAAVDAGERNPEQLKLVALDAVDCRILPDELAGK
jgi:hypothetical protein